jgi:hypothetical protein
MGCEKQVHTPLHLEPGVFYFWEGRGAQPVGGRHPVATPSPARSQSVTGTRICKTGGGRTRARTCHPTAAAAGID